MSNKNLFLLLLLSNFIASLFLLFSVIDQDFYAYLYFGKGVANGLGIYKDFADNKGPFYYVFFAIFYLLFKNNYTLGLVLTSTFIDALCVFLMFKIVQRDWSFIWFKKDLINIILVVFCMLLYKSFSIGSIVGSFYSENLGMLLLLLSIWYLGKKYSIISGVLFSLSVLTRQTYLFFAPYLLIQMFFKYKNPKQFMGFFLGGLIPLGIFTVWFWLNKELKDFFYNVFTFNLNYAKATKNSHNISILFRISFETRILITIFISLLYTLLELLSNDKQSKKLTLITLLISSILATFMGGIFYTHHFIQFSLIAFIAITSLVYFPKLKQTFLLLLFLLLLFLIFNFYFYFEQGRNSSNHLNPSTTNITEINDKKYMVVMPYYPVFYINYNKTAPDKYCSYLFLSSYKNINNKSEIKRHQNLDKNKLSDTVFIFVTGNDGDKKLIKEYKNNFTNKFKLVKLNEYYSNNTQIEIYESTIEN